MKYRVEGGAATIGADMVLTLSADQVAARRHMLEPVDGGKHWRPRQVVQFKSGEIIGIDVLPDDLPRSLDIVLVAQGKWRKRAKAMGTDADTSKAGDDPAGDGDEGDPEDASGAGDGDDAKTGAET
jgi:hypothetical protein